MSWKPQYTHLSTRQLQIMTCMFEGHTDSEICRILNIKIGTLAIHKEVLYRRLGVRQKAHALLAAAATLTSDREAAREQVSE